MAGSGWQPCREEGLGTKLKGAESPGPGNSLDGGVVVELRGGRGRGVPHGALSRLGCLRVLRPCPRMEGTVLGEES